MFECMFSDSVNCNVLFVESDSVRDSTIYYPDNSKGAAVEVKSYMALVAVVVVVVVVVQYDVCIAFDSSG